MRVTHLKDTSVIFIQQHVSRSSCRAAWFIIIIIVISSLINITSASSSSAEPEPFLGP
jgi:uncharacterized Rmd1/YagE family protein